MYKNVNGGSYYCKGKILSRKVWPGMDFLLLKKMFYLQIKLAAAMAEKYFKSKNPNHQNTGNLIFTKNQFPKNDNTPNFRAIEIKKMENLEKCCEVKFVSLLQLKD